MDVKVGMVRKREIVAGIQNGGIWRRLEVW